MRRIPNEPLACYSGESCEYIAWAFLIVLFLGFVWLLVDGLFRIPSRRS